MTDSPGTLFDSLLAVMARLRAEEGCPWDREQTRASLKPYLIEEAYEALEALEGGERDAIMEELGDLLFQVVFHAQVARELGEFTMADLLERLVAKMVRRPPHVFGEAKGSTAREAFSQGERIKHEEATRGGASRSVLDGVPQSLPALLRAQRLQEKAARTGFDWKDAAGGGGQGKEKGGGGGEGPGRNRDRAAMKARIGKTDVVIERGDLTDWEVDAIVNAANSHLWMGAGVAGAIKRKGGGVIEEEAVRRGPMEAGEAVITTAGNLPATHVIHAAAMGQDLKTDAPKIAQATRSSLALADKRKLTSIAFPAQGGTHHPPQNRVGAVQGRCGEGLHGYAKAARLTIPAVTCRSITESITVSQRHNPAKILAIKRRKI